MRDKDIFRREFLGRVTPEGPSPGPWIVKEHREHNRFSGGTDATFVVLDANGRCVAECERYVDAIHIARHAPFKAERDAPAGRKGK